MANRFNPGNLQIATIANPTEVDNIAEGHPVWKVSMGNNAVIVKAEVYGGRGREAALASATFGVMLMSAVTPGMEAQKLTQNELRAICDIDAARCKPQGSDHGAATKHMLKDVLKDRMDQYVAFKMPFVTGLMMLDKAMETHKTAEFAQHLVADDYAATIELGKILAVDLFCGNDDRFDPQGRLINTGNVMLRKVGDKWHAIGLDHYSAQGLHSDLTKPPANRQNDPWGGPRLNSTSQMLNYAGKILTALNAKGNRGPDLGLPSKFQEKLAQGLAEGAAMIRTTVQNTDPSVIPDGIEARFGALHWDMRPPPRSNTNPVQVVDNIISGVHAPQPTNNGGRQSPGLSTSGGRQSPGPTTTGGRQSPGNNTTVSRQSPGPTTTGGRQSPGVSTTGGRQSPGTTTNNLKRSSK